MRTVPLKSVYDAVIRLHGLNPRSVRDEDVASSITMHINSRVEQIALAWDWPEWNVTEERAFRQVWNAGVQYFRAGAAGTPDEVYFMTTGLYYTVNKDAPADPPVGMSPTDTPNFDGVYWIQIVQVDPYVEYDQPGKRSIGQVLGVYSVDPRTTGCCSGPWMLNYHPSEFGIDVCGSGPTVFILYQQPVPVYSMLPYIAGIEYHRGNVILNTDTNECSQALATTTDSPTTLPASWQRVPFLQKWFDFVKFGAFADSLGEIDQGNSIDPNVRAGLAASAEGKAMTALQRQVDSLVMQGQRLTWNFCKTRHWCQSQPWLGGTVTTLTDAIESDPIFSTHPMPTITDEYHPEIVSLSTTAPALTSLPTKLRLPKSIVKIVIFPIGLNPTEETQEWKLEVGTAEVGNPGELNPTDYNAISNLKFWRRVR